ncbi:MAG: right-handed parallel beta-helix repeat-containing protein [Candidatus Zixiibacteriota bacterium]|nr:MAG: right-handed parallel beta-helix repeat-containing protein [candidate division Zixibacteria bacterium]
MRRLLVIVFLLSCLASDSGRAEQEIVCPDLEVISFVLFGPQRVTPGEILGQRVATMLKNSGNTESFPYSVGLYLSTDAQITTADQILFGGREAMGNLVRLGIESVPVWDSVQVPPSWPTGPAYLGVLVDEFEAVTEWDEFNNTAAVPIEVSAGGASLLQVPAGYATISDAIAAASAGDTIAIDSGDYDEELLVDKDLIIVGAGWDKTVIKNSLTNDHILKLDSADVVLQDLQLWSAPGEPYWLVYGIIADNSSMVIRNCKFIEIGAFNVEAIGGAVYVENIYIESIMGVTDIGVRIFDGPAKFRNSYGGSRIDHVFDLRGTSAGVIEGNSIVGSTIYYGQGIRLMDSAVAVIRNNQIIGQHDSTTQTTHQPAGIAMHGDAFADIHDNEIHTFVYGLYFGNNADARVYDNMVTDNILHGVRANLSYPAYDGSTPDLGGGVYLSPGSNTIHSNGPYNVKNNSPQSVWALWNLWGTTDSATIDGLLYDDDEDPNLGEVIFLPKGTATPPGINVMVVPDSLFKILFRSVIASGLTWVDPGQIGPEVPVGYRLVPSYGQTYYEVRTTADFSDSVEVTISYEESSLVEDESGLKMMHYEGSRWLDVTSGLSLSDNQVWGMVESFSLFALVEPLTCVDTDHDGFGDPGQPENECPTDNCPNHFNPGQEDSNGDGLGDACCCFGISGNVDCDPGSVVDIGDLTRLIDYLFISFDPICCPEEANIDGDTAGMVDIGDLTALIDYLFISFTPPAVCM